MSLYCIGDNNLLTIHFSQYIGGHCVHSNDRVEINASLTFLISVNDSWGDCIATVKTYPIRSNTPLNKSQNIQVGNCDNGPLEFRVTQDGSEHNNT